MLQTKLHIPASGANLVQRTSLFDKLNEGLNRKLILISAPAGFGKTTAASDWINHYKIPTAWFSIDNSDNDPNDFLSYIISGIQGLKKDFGINAYKLLKSPNQPASESIINLLINDIIDIKYDFLLVFDDFHLINNPEIYKLLTYLLEYIPENIHLVISTRSDPNLPIAKLRSKFQLVELRSADLSFTANEIAVLFNKKFKLKLSAEDIYSLENKTEGWIAGLQLAALSLQGQENTSAFIGAFAGNNRYIMDYLIEEVLRIQPDDVKDFLLKTSVLEQFSAPLCNALLNRNDSQFILEKLENNNMFVVPLDTERHWYRYHHLFANLLKQRLLQYDKPIIEELHNKACEWFEQNNMFDLAIEHALANNDYAKAILLINKVVETMWENGQHTAILKYGDIIPEELIKENAEFCLYYAWILIIAGKVQKAVPYLISAETITNNAIIAKNSNGKELTANKKLMGKIAVAFAYMNSFMPNSEKSVDYCKIAMENLSENDPLWYSWACYTVGLNEAATENFKESMAAYEKALEYGKKTGNIYLISTIAITLAYHETRMGLYESSYKKCYDLILFMKESGYSQITHSESTYAVLYSNLAGIECMRTDFEEALENVKIAHGICKNETNSSYKVLVLLVYSLVLYGKGDICGAKDKLDESENIIRQNKVAPSVLSIFVGWKGSVLVEENEIEKATIFLKENGLELDKKKSNTDEHAYVAYVYLLIAEFEFDKAEALLSELYFMAKATNRTERMIEHKVLFAILYKMKGNKEKALAYLVESMKLAVGENIIITFLLYHDKINDLLLELYKIQATTVTKIPGKLIDKLKLAIEKRGKYLNQNQTDLSSRELDTLKLIAEELRNQEIADKLFVSLNTIKTHVTNIRLKLGVNSRSKAVEEAKKRGIL